MSARSWRPSPALQASFGLHGAVAAGLLLAPQFWPAALGALLADHALLTAAGLWPRSRLLGPNLTRLPAPAAARGQVAITIDDGPEPTVTPRVLDLLDGAGASASFFCIGEQAAAQPALAREIVTRGHSVENHSLRHLKRFATLGWRAMEREIADGQARLADITGVAPRCFRAPAGLRSPLLEPLLCRHGLLLASWTRRAFDTRQGDPAAVHRRLTTGLAAGDILLLHDGHAARTRAGGPVILEALPPLLASLGRAGLTPVTLPAALDAA